jgi:hypothetical protein
MRLPTIEGIIRRRILVNYRLDPQFIRHLLPARFAPRLYQGQAVAGICLIRLEHIRPKMLPEFVGISSENAAHRIAVVWRDEQDVAREGVFVPRRDTDSRLNHLLGGRIFPGEQHKADFTVTESGANINLSMRSNDGEVAVELKGNVAGALPRSSIFESLSASSSFFESGSVGYSITKDPCRLDGMVLQTKAWRVEPLEIERVYSSYFADEAKFPKGSVEFDHALIMRDIAHEWHSATDLRM